MKDKRNIGAAPEEGHAFLDGILTENRGLLLPGLVNSFLVYDSAGFWRKHRHYWLFIALSALQLLFLFTDVQVIGFGKGEGFADFTRIALDMGGFHSRRRSSEIVEIDEVFGNQYVEDKKKVVDPSKVNVNTGGSDYGDDYGEGDGAGGFGGAIDLSFRPEVRVPRLVTRLKKVYPAGAREMNLEARLMTEVLITSEGLVKGVRVVWISLSKELPAETTQKFRREFSNAARQILMGAQFTPAVVGGKTLNVRMEQPLNFVLE